MKSNILKSLNLIWRIVGGTVILLVVIFVANKRASDSIYCLIGLNIATVIFMTFNIIVNRLTMESTVWSVLAPYFINKIVNLFLASIYGVEKDILTVGIILEGIWIFKFYIVSKVNMVKRDG